MPPSISDPAPEPAIVPNRRWPADYYSSATPDPVLPRGVSYGCGAVSLAVLLIVFLGGAFATGEGLAKVMDLSIGMTLGEMRGMYAAEVTKAQKDVLERETEAMRERLRGGAIPPGGVQPFIRTLEKAMRDDKVTPAEVDQLTAAARNAVAKKRP